MRYGYFDDEKREYVITNPRTPVKWINYVGSLDFGGIVDHTGGSLICKGDPALNRITRYIHQLPDGEFKGETLYLRFKEGGGYRGFSARAVARASVGLRDVLSPEGHLLYQADMAEKAWLQGLTCSIHDKLHQPLGPRHREPLL